MADRLSERVCESDVLGGAVSEEESVCSTVTSAVCVTTIDFVCVGAAREERDSSLVRDAVASAEAIIVTVDRTVPLADDDAVRVAVGSSDSDVVGVLDLEDDTSSVGLLLAVAFKVNVTVVRGLVTDSVNDCDALGAADRLSVCVSTRASDLESECDIDDGVGVSNDCVRDAP